MPTIMLLVRLLAVGAAPRSLDGTTILITAPPAYAGRLSSVLKDRGARVLSLPCVQTELLSGHEKRELRRELLGRECDYVAFTSRRGVEAAAGACGPQLCEAFGRGKPTAIALGADADALVARGVPRDRVLVPRSASPDGIVSMLRSRVRRRDRASTTVLCPVPRVDGLTEPRVVPRFVDALRRAGFRTERFPAYVTRWPGPDRAARSSVRRLQRPGEVDAIAITSTAEVEGLLRYCAWHGVQLPGSALVPIVAHGPVTAAGARAMGVRVAAVNRNSHAFAGLADAIARTCARRLTGECLLALVDGAWLLD